MRAHLKSCHLQLSEVETLHALASVTYGAGELASPCDHDGGLETVFRLRNPRAIERLRWAGPGQPDDLNFGERYSTRVRKSSSLSCTLAA